MRVTHLQGVDNTRVVHPLKCQCALPMGAPGGAACGMAAEFAPLGGFRVGSDARTFCILSLVSDSRVFVSPISFVVELLQPTMAIESRLRQSKSINLNMSEFLLAVRIRIVIDLVLRILRRIYTGCCAVVIYKAVGNA